jgi:GT2 family glycosyltransferase
MNSYHKVSVIIHTYYRHDYLKRVLEILREQTLKPSEIIISDQTPLKDRPENFYEDFSDLPLNIINLNKPSHAPAQNIGAKASSGDILVFLDDDCEFRNDFVEQHVRVIDEENVDVVVGPNSLVEELPKTFQRHSKQADPISFFLKNLPTNWNGMVLYTIGGNTSVKRKNFFDIGGYDEKVPRMADIELGFRLFKSGAKMYHSVKPFVHHLKSTVGGSRKAQPNLQYLRLMSWLYIYRKHFQGWSTRQFILKEFFSYILFREPISGEFKTSSLKNPLLPLIRIVRFIRAISESGKLLK